MKPFLKPLAMLILLGACLLASAETLSIGSTAPPIKVEKWLKSTPIESFQPGKVYVLEFWATWCPPCRESIPHLTQLAKKFSGKAIFAGISISEEQKSDTDLSYVDVVRKFVNAQASKMDYHVAVDRPDRTMATSWMQAAGEDGIPTAFVIDQKGKIAWIGHPMQGLDSAVEQVVSNKFDAKKAGEERNRDKAKTADLSDPQSNGSMTALAVAIQHKDWKAAATTCDVIFASDRSQEKLYGPIKFLALLQTDEAAAYKYGHRVAEGLYKESPMQLSTLSQMILSEEYGPKRPDTSFALQLAEQSVALSQSQDPAFLDTLANAELHANAAEKALETDQKALHLLDTTKLYPAPVLDQIRALITKRLDRIKQQIAGAGPASEKGHDLPSTKPIVGHGSFI